MGCLALHLVEARGGGGASLLARTEAWVLKMQGITVNRPKEVGLVIMLAS